MRWIELSVSVCKKFSEYVQDVFYSHDIGGVVILENEIPLPDDEWGDSYENMRFESIDDDVLITGYIPDDNELKSRLQSIENSLIELKDKFSAECELNFTFVQDEDWENEWKKYYKPLLIGEKIVIKPNWEEYEAEEGKIVINIDPGMAFGTGTHETTSMCLELLQKGSLDGFSVYDLGTGSGILSIAAANLGAAKIIATDKDAVAVRTAIENIELNDLTERVSVIKTSVLDIFIEKVDLIIANIIASVIIDFCPDISRLLKPGGRFIASGIIKERSEEVMQYIIENGMNVQEQRNEGEWVAFDVRRNED